MCFSLSLVDGQLQKILEGIVMIHPDALGYILILLFVSLDGSRKKRNGMMMTMMMPFPLVPLLDPILDSSTHSPSDSQTIVVLNDGLEEREKNLYNIN